MQSPAGGRSGLEKDGQVSARWAIFQDEEKIVRKPFLRSPVVMWIRALVAAGVMSTAPALAQTQNTNWPNYREDDFIIKITNLPAVRPSLS